VVVRLPAARFFPGAAPRERAVRHEKGRLHHRVPAGRRQGGPFEEATRREPFFLLDEKSASWGPTELQIARSFLRGAGEQAEKNPPRRSNIVAAGSMEIVCGADRGLNAPEICANRRSQPGAPFSIFRSGILFLVLFFFVVLGGRYAYHSSLLRVAGPNNIPLLSSGACLASGNIAGRASPVLRRGGVTWRSLPRAGRARQRPPGCATLYVVERCVFYFILK